MFYQDADPYGGGGGDGGGYDGGYDGGSGGVDTGITGGTDPTHPPLKVRDDGWWEFFNGAWHWMTDPVPKTMLQP
jgi:hypothetical protein